jgi:hypothetical protein
MYHLIEAETWKRIRRFLIAAGTGREAAQEMAALIDRGALMDESGNGSSPSRSIPRASKPAACSRRP